MMRPKTGEILAMANYPDFNPNEAFTPSTEELKTKWDTMGAKEKSEALSDMWRNKAISNTAEPGSTFKIVTSSAVLEEGLVELDQPGVFNCAGAMKIGGWTIRCWRHPRSHGSQSLREGIKNSCNPVFMQSAQKVGIERYCEYLEAFNLKEKTGIDLPGEVGGILHDPKNMTEVDLATTGFGQTFQITALQSLVTVAAVSNGGNIITPYVVKEIKSQDGSIISKTEPKIKKQVISSETAADILDALYTVVEDGTGKAARVRGYSVGGKTGTGEQERGANLWYLASFVGVAPINDPEVCIVFNLYNPKGPQGHQGGTICAPVVSNILDETLRYLDINPDYTLEENNIKEILVPDLTGKSYEEAEKTVKELGFILASDSKFETDDKITNQIPKLGASLVPGSTIRVYKTDDVEKITVKVPDVRDKTLEKAIAMIRSSGLNIRIIGNGNAIIQEPSAGETVQKGSIVTVKFVDTTDLH
ncbi:MAG: penicillin-binding transpeptidase domain-containing protein [Clostridia bacterium]|nr:penicillin-binding transpeptidase domain-containing protein [Clostridia bacterium]MDD4375465.1 penicillin-binding transpeptidase domain-containing protein [Clostridia bacterium]